MHSEQTRLKVSLKLKEIGHKPALMGGNGRGLTVPQKALLEILGDGWFPEFAVKTGMKRDSGYPTCYKLDLANPELMIGIEVDGASHVGAKKQLDKKKDLFLETLGWNVYRLTNAQAMSLSTTCMSPDTLLTSLKEF